MKLQTRMLLSITLLIPSVGIVTTPVIHAAAEEQATQAEQQVQNFFSEGNNLDKGITAEQLHTAIADILANTDKQKATEWNAISIYTTPDKAAEFLHANKTLCKNLVPANKNDISIKIRETVAWERVNALLFTNDQAILNTYIQAGWDALVTELRELLAGTEYADIANALPYMNDFQEYTFTPATRRAYEVQAKLTQYNNNNRLPKLLQNNSKYKKGTAFLRLPQLTAK